MVITQPETRNTASPIELCFWQGWLRVSHNNHSPHLITQFKISNYRVDFCHIASKTVVELYGFADHHTTSAISYDCLRMRCIQAQGWYLMPFGASEVFRHGDKVAQEVLDTILRRMV